GVTIDAITSIHYFEFDDSFRDDPEAHEPWELVYVDRGECGVVADGRTFACTRASFTSTSRTRYICWRS
ncbi:MAG: hypothetical protein IJF73_07395, partial [Clostridia bacterium]|nr:hypothetical protein [Clostridia bacterium]